MKKSCLILIAAAAMLAACSDSDTYKSVVKEQNTVQTLSFSAYADKVTRGSNSTALKDFYTVFGVYGWKTVDGTVVANPVFSNHPNEYFVNDAKGDVVYDGTDEKPSQEWAITTFTLPAWFYEDVRYWDKMADNYQFFAIAPYEATPTYTVDAGDANIAIASSSAKYDVSTEYNLARTDLTADPVTEDGAPSDELVYSGFKKDYMIAEKKVVAPTGTITTNDVQLVFHHVLTKLNVKIQKSENYKGKQILKVNELKIANLDKKGNFVYNTNMTTNGWTKADKYDIDINTPYSLANDATNYDQKYWIETLIFPQTTNCKKGGAQPTATDLTDRYLYIQYQIGDEIFNAYYDLAYVFDVTTAPVEEVLYTAADQEVIDGIKNVGDVKTQAVAGKDFEFKQGSQYNLTITVGPDPIHFEANVAAWELENEVNLPVN